MKVYQLLFLALAAFLFINCGSGNNATVVPKSDAPTDVLKTFVEAMKKKDVEAVKKTLSKGSLALAEKTAALNKTTVDEMFRRDDVPISSENLETRNERIESDTATVEVKNQTTGFETIPLVKEDGAWKISLDKYQEIQMEKMRQEMNQPANLSSQNANKPANK